MFYGHLRKRPHHSQCNERSQREAQDHAGPRQFHGNCARQKKPSADGAAQPDHCHFYWAQLILQPSFALNELILRSVHHSFLRILDIASHPSRLPTLPQLELLSPCTVTEQARLSLDIPLSNFPSSYNESRGGHQ